MRSHSSCRAQSVIEYLLVVTAVVVVLITAILLKGGLFVKGVDSVLGAPVTLLNAHNGEITFPGPPCEFKECLPGCGPLVDNCGYSCGVGNYCEAGYTCKDTGNMSECMPN